MEFEIKQINGKDIIASSPTQDRDYRVCTYDFKRPDKFSLDQIRTITVMHETFASLASITLSGLMRHKVQVSVKAVDQMTYSEFIQSIPNPTTMAIIDMSPLKGSALLEIDPRITSAMNDRLFGGAGVAEKENTTLSIIEENVLEEVVERLLPNLKESWLKASDINPRIVNMATKPEQVMIAPPTEMVFLVSFEVTVGSEKGFMNFCVPFLLVEPIIEKFSAFSWYSTKSSNRAEVIPSSIVSSMKIDCEVITKAEDLNLKMIGAIKRGTMIKLDGFSEGLSSLRMGGEVVFNTLFGKGRNRNNFEIIDNTTEDAQNIISLIKPDNNTDKIEDNIKDLSNQLSHLSTSLIHRIEDISTNQDHLNDQVFLNSGKDSAIVISEGQPLSFIRHSDLVSVYQLISNSHNQLIALILSRLESSISAKLLEMFPDNVQTQMISKISNIVPVAPELLAIVGRVLKESLEQITDTSEIYVNGLEIVTSILSNSSRSVEKNVIEGLENNDHELADAIKKRMFVFEDIVLLDPSSIQPIVDRIDINDLYLSMKMVDKKVSEFIYTNVDEKRKEDILKGIDSLGRVRISDIENAQLKIIAVIKQMEENGEIVVCHPNEVVE